MLSTFYLLQKNVANLFLRLTLNVKLIEITIIINYFLAVFSCSIPIVQQFKDYIHDNLLVSARITHISFLYTLEWNRLKKFHCYPPRLFQYAQKYDYFATARGIKSRLSLKFLNVSFAPTQVDLFALI